jgi:hypothetical protein
MLARRAELHALSADFQRSGLSRSGPVDAVEDGGEVTVGPRTI